MTNIYVLNADNTPLMPCHSWRRVKRMLNTEKARVVCVKEGFDMDKKQKKKMREFAKAVRGITHERNTIPAGSVHQIKTKPNRQKRKKETRKEIENCQLLPYK